MTTVLDLQNLTLKIRTYERFDGSSYIKGFSDILIDDNDTHRLVCQIPQSNPHHEPEDLDVAQAYRIVAAVNAFKGIPTDKIAEYAEQFANDQRKGMVDPNICFQCGKLAKENQTFAGYNPNGVPQYYVCPDCYSMYYFPGE